MHFTYQLPEGPLQQGDVLARTPEIDALLKEVHPHYHSHPEYRHLIVLTQSCDLIPRSRPTKDEPSSKTRYITLAAVRPLTTALTRELEKHQLSPRERRARYCSDVKRHAVLEFVERLLNNNEPGYFYLHPDSEVQLLEPFVAFLALSIAVKADLHYAKCLAARIAQLKGEFQAKLGGLVGNLYSRVGTTDWYDRLPQSDVEKMIDEHVDHLCSWVPARLMDKISREEKRRTRENPEYVMSETDVQEYVKQLVLERENKKNQLAQQAVAVLKDAFPEGPLSDKDLERFEQQLINDQRFTALAK